MTTFHRYLQLLSMTVWVGGLVFFAFVLAPTAFHILPAQHEAGLVVGASLHAFDYVALAAGGLFLVSTALLFQSAPKRIQGRYEIEFLLACVMLMGTAYIHFNILPSMETDRARANGDIQSVAPSHPARVHFEKLHARSERVESFVLITGLVVLFFVAREKAQLEPAATSN